MEFIPETIEAFGQLDALVDDTTLADGLQRAADDAQRIAPGLTGVSVASRDHDLTFTLVATGEETALLDSVQYLESGPCVDAIDAGRGIATSVHDMLDEPRWRAFAQASAAAGVQSTLTMPIMEAGVVVGTVNLYGRSHDTFDGLHRRLAEVFSAWAPGAVTNADLDFSTRARAAAAPDRLRDDAVVDAATGIVAASYELSVDEARESLHSAASRAGIPVVGLARLVVDLFDGDER